MTTGALGLTDTEENQIVAFLQTLTDGFNPANPTVDLQEHRYLYRSVLDHLAR